MRTRTDPNDPDTDNDSLKDGRELDGFAKCPTRQTNPLLTDTDKDGASDRQEVTGSLNGRHAFRTSDPTAADTDWVGRRTGAS